MNYLVGAIGVFVILVSIIGFVRTMMGDFDDRRRAVPLLANKTLGVARAISATGCIVAGLVGVWTAKYFWA